MVAEAAAWIGYPVEGSSCDAALYATYVYVCIADLGKILSLHPHLRLGPHPYMIQTCHLRTPVQPRTYFFLTCS